MLLPLDEDAVRARRAAAEAARRALDRGDVPVLVREPRRTSGGPREIVLEEFPDVEHISLSHEVMPRGPEFERVSTTLVNAYVAPRIAHYIEPARRTSCGRAGYARAAADHAVDRRRHAARLRRPPRGDAARLGPDRRRHGRGARGASAAGVGDFVAVDMGGTSFDICLVRGGQPEIKTDWNWRYRYYIGLPMVDVQSVGAGGGSIARVRQGALLVGPGVGRLDARARSATGAAATGPRSPTPTPCSATCPPTGFAGGRMTPRRRRRRAPRSQRDVAEPLGLDVDRGGVGHRAHRQRQHGQRDAPGARRPRRRPPRRSP